MWEVPAGAKLSTAAILWAADMRIWKGLSLISMKFSDVLFDVKIYR